MKQKTSAEDTSADYDVIIVGAGLSGIGAAFHVQSKCKNKKIAILEARDALGGTWDLFRYPGIRSDSDMYTLGFSFNPWKSTDTLAPGPSILQYIKDTASKFGIDKKIKYNHKVINASWSDEEKLWTIGLSEHDKVDKQELKCRFLFMCSGYYDYDSGYDPEFPNTESFEGVIVHPQKWDPEVNYDNKKVVVIGSGATAVTMVPEMAKTAEKVTMLQRSPTYIMSMPGEDVLAKFFAKILPDTMAYHILRWKNILLGQVLYRFSRWWPDKMKNFIIKKAQKDLGKDYDMKHFTPSYNPWDQRLCVVPDSDLFHSINEGKAEVVTDTIKEFAPKGIILNSGKELEADIVVKATGLKLKIMGGMTIKVNGEVIHTGDLCAYRGVMFSKVPNFAVAVGYTNATWTLKCDLNCHFVTRIINHMDRKGYASCTPQFDPDKFETGPLLDFEAGYIKRSLDILPKQGSAEPWKVYQNYFKDLFSLKYSDMDDKYLEYR